MFRVASILMIKVDSAYKSSQDNLARCDPASDSLSIETQLINLSSYPFP
jgi:hypothetical protein